MSEIIILPTAKMHCECGNHLAPNRKAAERMRLPSYASQTEVCDCGKLIVKHRQVTPRASVEDAGEVICSCCKVKKSDVRVEISRNQWEHWCLDCVEERDSVISERFAEYLD